MPLLGWSALIQYYSGTSCISSRSNGWVAGNAITRQYSGLRSRAVSLVKPI